MQATNIGTLKSKNEASDWEKGKEVFHRWDDGTTSTTHVDFAWTRTAQTEKSGGNMERPTSVNGLKRIYKKKKKDEKEIKM